MQIARSGIGVVLAGAAAVGLAVAVPAQPAAAAPAVRWTADLRTGDAVGVDVAGGTVRLAPAPIAPADAGAAADGHGEARPAGLLTLPAHPVAAPVQRVEAALDARGDVVVDVRGLRAGGTWTEWLTAEPDPSRTGPVAVVLPAAVTAVQARLVLPADPGAPDPEVRGLTLAAFPAPPPTRTRAQAQAPRAPQRSRVFATREGLVGHKTANGHVVAPNDLFAALPSRRSLAPRDTGDYTVKVCTATGRCAFAPVWDVGPWNTRDDYWNPSGVRQSWPDLPRGLPEAQAAQQRGYHGGKDQFGRTVKNPAGIDLADGLFRTALGLRDNAWVDVDYLWTGDAPLTRVDRGADLRAAAKSGAPVVGRVAPRAEVPLQCVSGKWLRVGTGLFLPTSAVPRATWPGPLPSCARG